MKRQAFGLVLLTLSQAIAFSQSGPPKQAIDITDADVKEVLKHSPPAVDQQLRVVDMGKYNLAVGIIHRGKSTDRPDHVDYLSVRPDPDRVLPAGYFNPALKK
jgi:hypothetical protein